MAAFYAEKLAKKVNEKELIKGSVLFLVAFRTVLSSFLVQFDLKKSTKLHHSYIDFALASKKMDPFQVSKQVTICTTKGCLFMKKISVVITKNCGHSKAQRVKA